MVEIVHAIIEFWDYPRSGVSFYQGKPIFFECIFDNNLDEYSDKYKVKFLNMVVIESIDEIARLEKKWDNAEFKSENDKNSYPVLAVDRVQFDAVTTKLESQLIILNNNYFILIPEFTVVNFARKYMVKWKEG